MLRSLAAFHKFDIVREMAEWMMQHIGRANQGSVAGGQREMGSRSRAGGGVVVVTDTVPLS